MENIKADFIPEPDNENKIIINDDITMYNCSVMDNGNIKGFYFDPETMKEEKALFDIDKMLYVLSGKNIRLNNLVSLKDRTKEERTEIGNKARQKAKENRENKKNFNELAKAMLEQTVSEDQIKAVLGDNTSILLDNSVSSLILAAMVRGAVEGSFKCAEFVRDTAGYKPKNEVEVAADIMTDADRSLIENISKRIG